MTEGSKDAAGAETSPPLDPKELERIERLRDRTDEIELIISGLTTVALFSLPGWLFEAISSRYSHQPLGTSEIFEILLVLAPGLFYALGGCFAVHLTIRAYWAGLAGLRSVYPGGIVWDRVPGLGRITREDYKRRLPDLSRAITSADHTASALFAVISMTALGMLWISAWMLVTLIAGQALGQALDDVDRGSEVALWFLMVLFVGAPTLLWLLDASLGRRFPGLADRPAYRAAVRGLLRFNSWIWPQRLILPVQLTLQSNTRPYLFSLMVALSTAGIIFIGFVRYDAWTEFSISDEFRYLEADALDGGIDSAHYESLRGVPDRLRLVPTIDDFEQRSAFLRVFLPYFPRRDNPVLDARCDDVSLDCLRGLWTVRLGSSVVDPSTLLATERRDLNQRGLTAVLPLTDRVPGVHVLDVVWNPAGAEDATRSYRIPFLFTPDQELGASAGDALRFDLPPF